MPTKNLFTPRRPIQNNPHPNVPQFSQTYNNNSSSKRSEHYVSPQNEQWLYLAIDVHPLRGSKKCTRAPPELAPPNVLLHHQH